jgi:CDGSH-type Zn-finger protein
MGMSDLRPVEFVAETTCEKWICMCKQTNHRPFCDGVHKTMDQTPRDDNRSRYVMYKTGPVYEGVAKKLGYIVKDGEQ